MKALLVCCEVFIREVSLYISKTTNRIFPVYTDLGAHEQSDHLRERIQDFITNAEKKGYDYILLGYGLCGNVLHGIRALSVPVIAIRAHDCCTVFLGSKHKFHEFFGENLSSQWSSAGYMERGDDYIHRTDTGRLLGLNKGYEDYIEEYGEENARYIWETLHPEEKNKPLIYIETDETEALGYREVCERKADEDGRPFSCIRGDGRLLKALIEGNWPADEFQEIPPGYMIEAVYDAESIIKIVPAV